MDTLAYITETLEAAGELLRSHKQQPLEVAAKGGDRRNIVTAVDQVVEAFLIERIRDAHPHDAIYGEESGEHDGTSARQWTIDPIDGTSNFARDIPHYAIVLGLLDGGKPIAGGIYNPVTRELFSFERGVGAFCNGEPVRVSAVETVEDATVFLTVGRDPDQRAWGVAGYDQLLARGRVRNFGSTALDLCYVGAGRIDACVYGTMTTLDVAPALGFLLEAGGVALDAQGQPSALRAGPQRVYATNGEPLYQALRAVL